MTATGATPTVKEVLAEFLVDQQERLAPRTFDRYADIIGLLSDCLNNYGSRRRDRVEQLGCALSEPLQTGLGQRLEGCLDRLWVAAMGAHLLDYGQDHPGVRLEQLEVVGVRRHSTTPPRSRFGKPLVSEVSSTVAPPAMAAAE